MGIQCMKPGELVNYLVDLYRGFDPSVETIDIYLAQYLEVDPIEDEEDLAFVNEIVAGCTRYKRLLDVFLFFLT